MNIKSNFRMRLSELMKVKDITQAELCRMTNIPTSLVSAYITAKKIPGLSNSILIADALGVSLDDLTGREAKKDKPLTVSTTTEKDRLLNAFEKLNERGRDEAIKRVEEMAAVGYYLQQGNEDAS